MKATFGYSEAHTKYIKHICIAKKIMKPKANYKYMDTQMLIGLAMFLIKDQPMVSCFILEVVLLVGAIRNNQQLHYQA
jgi:hypothetical protein